MHPIRSLSGTRRQQRPAKRVGNRAIQAIARRSGLSGSTTETTTTRERAVGTNQFASEDEARSRCGSDTVVWVNLRSRIYHFAGNNDYGKTKRGAYMCEKEATTQGFRASKTEKRPSA